MAPLWMLVACCLVNLTTWRAARPVHAALRQRYRTPRRLALARPGDLEPLLRPLGLWRRRARSLVTLAAAFLERPPRSAEDVLGLPGCGRYAADSWAIFVEGRRDLEPTDHYLSAYLRAV